jgi:ankyrin repeat protein
MNVLRPLFVVAQLAWILSVQAEAAPIHDAAFRGDLTAVRELIARDSLIVHARDSLGATPLHYAALGGHHGLVELLAGRGAAVDARDALGSTPLHYAMRGGPRYPPIQGAFVRIDGLEAIYRPEDTLRPTAELPWNSVILSLIGRRADVNAVDGFGATPLHRAAGAGRILLARTLLSMAAEVNARDGNERTPLHWAVQAGNPQIVVLLMRDQADPNMIDEEGRTPLHFAAMFNRWDVARILVELGARINERDDEGMTAREYAEREGDGAMVELLEMRDAE